MNINDIQELSRLYNEVALFFSKYEPQQCTSYSILDDAPISDIKTIWKVFKSDSMTCIVDDFVIWYEKFRITLSEYVLSYRKETVQDIIRYYFRSTLFVPNVVELLKSGDVILVDLLEAFVKATEFINGLVDRTASGYYGLVDQYDSFKEESGQEKKEENYYTNEVIENGIQKMIANGTCSAIVNETIRDLVDDQAISLMQNACKQLGLFSQLPKELDTNEAKALFKRAIENKILNDNYQCLDLTMYQKRRFAELASEELKIKTKWKTFETLWNIQNLAQVKMYEADQESFKKVDVLFSKNIIDRVRIK